MPNQEEPSMEDYLTGRPASSSVKPAATQKSFMPEGLKTALILILVAVVLYVLYDGYQSQQKTLAELTRIHDQITALENRDKAGEAKLSTLSGALSQTQKVLGGTRQELKKTAQEIEQETLKTKAELSQAISTKADVSHVQAIKQEADSKIGQVSSEVGGVRSEVGTVKTDLATTKHDLEGTQRQLLDVKETLSAAVAKNASELGELRRKGERDFFEFEIPKKNVLIKVEDIRLILTNTDFKKGKYSVKVVVDDNQLEKKDRTVNEPVQFLVGRNRLRYELVVNWVQKDRIGGYLSIPKDKTLAAERTPAGKTSP